VRSKNTAWVIAIIVTALLSVAAIGSAHLPMEMNLLPKLDFVHFVMPALAPASQNGQSQRHFSMS